MNFALVMPQMGFKKKAILDIAIAHLNKLSLNLKNLFYIDLSNY